MFLKYCKKFHKIYQTFKRENFTVKISGRMARGSPVLYIGLFYTADRRLNSACSSIDSMQGSSIVSGRLPYTGMRLDS